MKNINVKKHLDKLKADGYVIIPNLICGENLKNLRHELDVYFQKTPPSKGVFWGNNTKRMGRVFSKSKESHHLATHPLILEIMNGILGPFCERIQINLTQAIQIGSGEYEQYLHQDDEIFPFPKADSEFMVNAMWAIDDFTCDNGSTMVWPGSHLFDANRQVQENEVIPAIMESGSVLIWLGSTKHAGGANNTPNSRAGLVISYCLGWLRQAENQYLAYPPDIAKDFPELLQDLIGYKVHRPNLGWYEGQEPDLLFHNRPDTLAAEDLFTPAQEVIAQQVLKERAAAVA